MHSLVTSRIYKNSVKRSAPETGFQAINGCAAQHSGQMCAFEGKNCRYFGSFTNIIRPSLEKHSYMSTHLVVIWYDRSFRQNHTERPTSHGREPEVMRTPCDTDSHDG